MKSRAALLVVIAVMCAPVALFGQSTPPAASATESSDRAGTSTIRKRLGLVATHAIACFRSADSIESNLERHGLILAADIAILRLRLEGSLDDADAALGRGDLSSANEALTLAEALVEKFAARLGG